MNANKTLGFVLTAAICAAMLVHADALPWDGARLVFGEAQRGGTFTLDAPATASEVDFIAPATLQGAELTLTPPALVRGGGALLTPLAGTDGVAVGWPAEIYTPTDKVSTILYRILNPVLPSPETPNGS